MQLPVSDTGTNVTGLLANQIPIYWESLCELLDKPLKRTKADKYYTADDVLWKCVEKKWQCWIAWHEDKIDCVFITYIAPYPTGFKSFVIYLVGGNRIDEWLSQAWNIFKEYAKAYECEEIVGMGRKGWLRELEKVEDAPLEPVLRFSVRI